MSIYILPSNFYIFKSNLYLGLLFKNGKKNCYIISVIFANVYFQGTALIFFLCHLYTDYTDTCQLET